MSQTPQRNFRSTCSALRFRKAARRVTQIYDHELEPFGLTITQYGILGHLFHFGGINVGALARKLVMDPTTLTRNLRPLERQGYVTLTLDNDDRRGRKLDLTEAGRARYKAARPGWQAAQDRIAATLGPENGAILADIIDGMIEDLRD